MKNTIKATTLVLFLAVLQGFSQVEGALQTAEPTREGVEFFEKKIRPVLVENCYSCHSAQAKKPQGGLLLDSREGVLKGGSSGQPAITPGDPEISLLIRAIRYSDPKLQMPFGGKLPDSVIKDFEEWVKMGAPDPRNTSTAAAFPVPAAYKYRNYVIKSFNEDKPYDQFIREQIAGDLLPSKTEAEKFDKIVATGYIAISRRFGSRDVDQNLTRRLTQSLKEWARTQGFTAKAI